MRLSAVFLSLSLASAVHALPVSGRLRELGTTRPIPAAVLSVQGSTLTAESDLNGRWTLALEPGEAVVKVQAEGYAAASFAFAVSPTVEEGVEAGRLDAGIWSLVRVDFEAEVVRVRGRREAEAPSRVGLQKKEIRRIAGIGRDPLRALQTLPGVVTPSDFSGQLAVRGGAPQDNLYYLNDVPWPVPFHYGGALSTVHGDLLDSVDLYPAAFPPRWGGVDGAILDARSRAPKRDQFHGQVDANLLLSEGLLEGPLGALMPDSNTAKADGGWLVSGRRSYFDLILPSLGNFTAVPRFWDLSALADYDLGPSDRLKLTALATDDLLALVLKAEDVASKDFEGEFRFRSAFNSVGLGWEHRGEGWRNTLTPFIYHSEFETSFGKGYGIAIKPTVTGLRQDLRFDAGDHEVGLGSGVENQNYQVFGYAFRRSSGGGSGFVTVTDAAGITISATATNGYVYLQDRWTLLRGLKLLGGARVQRVDQMGTEALDPRVNLEWQPLERTTFSAGWGEYSQFPTPRELSADFGNPSLGFNRTRHTVLGLEQGFGVGSSFKVEGYYKDYRDRVVEVADSRFFTNEGQGLAKGIELLLRQRVGERFFGWVSYSYAVSQRITGKGLDWTPYQYDQPHTLTVVGSYDVKPNWSAGFKLNAHSGPLITPGEREVDPSPNSTSGWRLKYGAPYSERLGDYVRLDVRTDYAILLEGAKINLYAEVINALNRPNPAGVTYNKDFSKRENVNNLPLLPYIGLGIEF